MSLEDFGAGGVRISEYHSYCFPRVALLQTVVVVVVVQLTIQSYSISEHYLPPLSEVPDHQHMSGMFVLVGNLVVF